MALYEVHDSTFQPIPDGGEPIVIPYTAVPGEVGEGEKLLRAWISMWISHPEDEALLAFLQEPSIYPPYSGGFPTGLGLAGELGEGPSTGWGTGPAEGDRTTFQSGVGAPPIKTGVDPFVGVWEPEHSLDALKGRAINGAWHLLIFAIFTGFTGHYHCSTLFLETGEPEPTEEGSLEASTFRSGVLIH